MPQPARDYVPRTDGEFSLWANNYVAALVDYYDKYSIDPTPLVDLGTALIEWNKDYGKHTVAQAAAAGAAARKTRARRDFETLARPIAAFVQSFPSTTNADRATIGITVRALGGPPAAAPATRPLARVDSNQRLSHTLKFIDEATPTRRAKPRGVHGAEVWVALTPPNQPAPPVGQGYQYLATNTRGQLLATFASAEAGKTAHYVLRWSSTRGEKGPWSEAVSATVAA